MRVHLIVLGLFAVLGAYAQQKPVPFSESNKAIMFLKQEAIQFDSLRKVYKKRVSIDVRYGQRFLLNSEKSAFRDSITGADFTERRAFYGLGVNYFISEQWSVGLEFNVTILPKDQTIESISIGSSGISGSGSGNGGVAAVIGLHTRYYFVEQEYFRPYAGIHLGTTNLVASGGEVTFSGGGQDADLETIRTSLRTGQLVAGFAYRTSPGIILDFNVGVSRTSKTDPIGGVTSYGGITTSLTMQFVLNHKNNK